MKNTKLMKVVSAIAIAGIAFSTINISIAEAATSKSLKVSNLLQISYPTNFKLPRSGCARVPIRYQINKLELDESYFTVVITDDQDRHIGEASWYGSNAESSTKAMAKTGTLQIKVCRDSWYDSVEDIDSYPTYKGYYDIYVSAVGDKSADASARMKFSE